MKLCKPFTLSFTIFFSFLITDLASTRVFLTFELKKNRELCFFEPAKKNESVSFDWYSISDEEEDENSITTRLIDPTGQTEVFHSEISTQEKRVNQEGVYEICFLLTRLKNVWLSLDIFKEEDSNFFEDNKKSGEAIFEIGQLYMQSLYNHLSQALRTLNYLRNRELHHRDIAESTANRVVLWSLVECLVLLSVAGVQVYLVRRMFSKSASYTSFK
ncbi:transmembrane emp24 domain-containing protein A-like isoform X1 [Zophobas morio]|jgi:hypothetical protein|uniref:transmembrane emp24 domain-containing protein A-like isoform X1 n=1 Tax=Zophobas morio TaxID=2755281 RepID=UPI003082831E